VQRSAALENSGGMSLDVQEANRVFSLLPGAMQVLYWEVHAATIQT
jgi:hypothetical protein